MGLASFLEERRADRQAALLDGLIQRQQGLAEFFHLRQLGVLGTAAQGAEFLAQRTQFLALLRMLVPALEQVLGVQQDVHAFGEEGFDQQRIAALSGIAVAIGLERGDALLVQRLDPLQQRDAAGNRIQRTALADLLQADAEQLLGVVQQLGFAQVEGEQVGLVFLDQFFQRRGDLGDRQDAGHVRAALEGMQGALQGVGDRLRQFAGAVGEEADQGLQVGLRLVGEDFQELRIEQLDVALRLGGGLRRVGQRQCRGAILRGHRLLRLDFRRYATVVRRRRFRQRLAPGQGMRGGRQQIDVVALALGVGGELLDQLRQQRHHLVDHAPHRLAGGDAAVEHAIEQVLDRPGQFADHQGADHPSAALEGMEGTAHFGQRLAVVLVGLPGRQVLADGLQDLAGLLDEDLAQLLVHRFLVGRRRQQADRHVLRRRVDRLHRRGHHLGQRQRRRFAGERLGSRRSLDLGQLHLGEIEVGKVQLLQARAFPGGHFDLCLRQGYIQRQRIERIESQLLFSGPVERLRRRQRFQAFQRRVEDQRRLFQARFQRLAGLRRLCQVIAEAPLLRQRPVRQGRRLGGRRRIGGQVEAGEVDLVEVEVFQAAGRRRGRLRLAALLDHLRQRRRYVAGAVQRQVQGQVEGSLAGVGRDFAQGPVVVAGQLRGIFPRRLGRSRVGGRL